MSKKILIIEDNVLNLKLTKKLITMSGLHALTAYNAEDGIRIARIEKPDLILMDIQLPGISGLDAARIIKADSDVAHIPIVALSAHAMKEEMNRAREAGCDGYITKPLDTRTFLKTLHGFISSEKEKEKKAEDDAVDPQNERPRILLADADPENRRMIKEYLSGLEAEIINAAGENGISASLNVFPDSIDLLIIGFVAPESRRFEAAEAFRADSATADIPVLAIASGPSEIEKAWAAGADAVISTPLGRDELIAKVFRLLKSKKNVSRSCLAGASNAALSGSAPSTPVLVFLGIEEKNVEKIMKSFPDEGSFRALIFQETREALEYARSGRTDVICTPSVLKDYNPISLCRTLKNHEYTAGIQILILSKNLGLEQRVRAIEAGCDDYVEMPVAMNELAARFNALIKKKERLDILGSRLENAVNSPITDVLTGLYSYSYFRHYLDLEVKRSVRQSYPASILVVELKDFGRYTEIHGNDIAEEIIRGISGLITSGIRAVDFPARLSVHKFGVIFPHTDRSEVTVVEERIKKSISEYIEGRSDVGNDISFRTGLAICPEEAIDAVALMNLANSRLIEQ